MALDVGASPLEAPISKLGFSTPYWVASFLCLSLSQSSFAFRDIIDETVFSLAVRRANTRGNVKAAGGTGAAAIPNRGSQTVTFITIEGGRN
jgi:hypothetical protein